MSNNPLSCPIPIVITYQLLAVKAPFFNEINHKLRIIHKYSSGFPENII